MSRQFIYDIIYALAARDGREAALFGASAPAAHEAFERSLAGKGFPELWFEVPLAGDPWFDLHALASRSELAPGMEFSADETGGFPGVFAWFAAQDKSIVRQLALSYDTGRGDAEHPAVQLLLWKRDVEMTCGFLEAAGRPDAVSAYRAFEGRIPEGWFACYTGVFPGRPEKTLRVECIPDESLQAAYADDRALLEAHLRQAGLRDLGDTLVDCCQLFARTPFKLEFQFDVEPDGSAGVTFSASVRFASPSGEDDWQPFEADGEAGELMEQVEAWGLADDRWRLFPDATYAVRVRRGNTDVTAFNFPAFLKLRWRAGETVDAKAYFLAGIHQSEEVIQ